MSYFPLFVELEGKPIALYGAGRIAARRLRGLLRFGAHVTVTAPEISQEVQELAEQYAAQVTVIRMRYRMGTIPNVMLVLSATDDAQVDRQIYDECREKGIPVNIASDQRLCDFYFPALMEHDGLVVGISSGGTDHGKVKAVSAALREMLAEEEEKNP